MGFFGTFYFDGVDWSEGDPEGEPSGAEPWLWLDVHDSDFATIRYAPAGSGSGIAFLEMTPRIYFESEGASAPTDINRESHGLTEWWATRNQQVDVQVLVGQRKVIAAFLATDSEPPEQDDDHFAEETAAAFLAAMGLPLPEDLRTGIA